ncbi:type II toxin-antitoxin system RelE/ParE family toxin [Xanthomonas campestris pv. esculenti]|nr:type II toxin-antitoxin system RelE/ParE family toxin [Xanthomonas campestris pv. esculenti]
MKIYHVKMTEDAQYQLDDLEVMKTKELGSDTANAFANELLDDAETLSENPGRGKNNKIGGNIFQTIFSPKTGWHIAFEIDEVGAVVYVLGFKK